MGFFDDITGVGPFKELAKGSYTRATTVFNDTSTRLFTPYYFYTVDPLPCSLDQSWLPPLCHFAQLFINVTRLTYGAVVLIGALTTGHINNAGDIFLCMGPLIIAAVIEALNIALALVSTITRLSTSLFYYQSLLDWFESTYATWCPLPEVGLAIFGAQLESIAYLAHQDEIAHQYACTLV